MDVRPLDRETYAGRRFTVCCRTRGRRGIRSCAGGSRMDYVPFGTPAERSFDDTFFGKRLERPVALGAFEGQELVGFAEGSVESWNRRFRISNICVFDGAQRGRGVGSLLMDAIQQEAAASGVRMIVLETQSCNERAIAFYKRHGFAVIGFDLYAYTNEDPERHEVRVEMGKKL